MDHTLQDIWFNDTDPFREMLVILERDFTQILPVVVQGNHAQIIDAYV